MPAGSEPLRRPHPIGARPTLGEKLRNIVAEHRNALISNASFQEFAAWFPLTRFVARRRAQRAFDLCAGFVYSQILQACVELELFERLRGSPLRLSEIAAQTGLSLEAAERLLSAAASLDLVERRSSQSVENPRFGLGQQGAAFLGNPGAMAMIAHHKLFYADLLDPVALLRGEAGETHLSRYWAYATAGAPAGLEPGKVADYSTLMASSQPLVSADILHAYPFTGHHRLLDIGGGDGAFLQSVARVNADIRLMLFDLPPVATRAGERFADSGLAGRAEWFGGDFKEGPLPPGADVISLIRVLHDHDDAVVRPLLRRVRDALPPGGTLVIGEPMADAPGARAMGDAYFGFYLLAMGSGRPRSVGELAAMLREAGFNEVRAVPTRRPMLTSLIVAK
ncbi:MAG: methyltransferase domain-containing protein [Beijerinckiaceae bacterium]|nr:methyltransferase domain-containing protein [Beijerinckiaceae bacterium]